jgi:hypothetical protein
MCSNSNCLLNPTRALSPIEAKAESLPLNSLAIQLQMCTTFQLQIQAKMPSFLRLYHFQQLLWSKPSHSCSPIGREAYC